MRDISPGEKKTMSDGAKYRHQKELARQRQTARRQKRKAAGEVLIQTWTSERFNSEAKSQGYKPIVVWARSDAKLPDTLFFLRSEELEAQGQRVTGYIFVPGLR